MARNRATRRQLALTSDVISTITPFSRQIGGPGIPAGFPTAGDLQRARGLPPPPQSRSVVGDVLRGLGQDALDFAGDLAKQKIEELLGGSMRDDSGPGPSILAQPTTDECQKGTFRPARGLPCIDIFPGGANQGTGMVASPGEFGTTSGAFGIPAAIPHQFTQTRRKCPPGMVLGRDNLCYPRQVLSRRNRMRKWRGSPRPPISRKDVRALQTIERVQNTIKGLAKQAGLTTKKK